jgi:hypothetical protein
LRAERLHDLFPSSQAASEKQADGIQRLCGRLECSDACDKSMWHACPHIKPSIDTMRHGALDVSSRVIEQHFVVADVNADGRQPGKASLERRRSWIVRVGAP